MRPLAFVKRRFNSEDRILWFVALSWVPTIYFYSQFASDFSTIDFYIGLLLILAGYAVGLWYLYKAMRRPLLTLSNLLLSMQEGDYGLRARQYHGLIGDVLSQTNDLAEILKALRIGEREAHLLLSKMIAAIDLAVFIFDHRKRLTLANPEAEKLMLAPEADLQGKNSGDLGLAPLMSLDEAVSEHQFPGGVGRWRIRHFVFFQDSQEHELLAISDVSRLLVEEERDSWQKLLRVLGHELNNSLVPIKNMSQTLQSILAKTDDYDEDLDSGLSLIGRRADALHRFVQGYARLTKLPPPRLARASLPEIIDRASKLENMDRVEVIEGPDVAVLVDSDQIDQVLLNLLNNAIDATDENGGEVKVSWQTTGGYASIVIEDYGVGISNADNLFVPFFTTKEAGSGIGLVLCKQIVESHQGYLTLHGCQGHEGAVATIVLPLAR